jgi:hypothetical protein
MGVPSEYLITSPVVRLEGDSFEGRFGAPVEADPVVWVTAGGSAMDRTMTAKAEERRIGDSQQKVEDEYINDISSSDLSAIKND